VIRRISAFGRGTSVMDIGSARFVPYDRAKHGGLMFTRAILLTLISLGAVAARADTLDKPVIGPKLICFKYSTFYLDEGESIAELSGSPEGISVSVTSRSGHFSIGEGEIFAPAKGLKRLVYSNGSTSVYRVRGRGGRYAIYGPTSFSNGKPRLIIWLTGINLRGRKNDKSVYSRFEIRDPSGLKCEHTFTYSWDFLPEQ